MVAKDISGGGEGEVLCSEDLAYYVWTEQRSGRVLAISPEKVFLGAEDLLPVGAMLTLRLRLPGASRTFTILGRVLSVALGGAGERRGMSVGFLDIAPRDREAIRSWATGRPVLCRLVARGER